MFFFFFVLVAWGWACFIAGVWGLGHTVIGVYSVQKIPPYGRWGFWGAVWGGGWVYYVLLWWGGVAAWVDGQVAATA